MGHRKPGTEKRAAQGNKQQTVKYIRPVREMEERERDYSEDVNKSKCVGLCLFGFN